MPSFRIDFHAHCSCDPVDVISYNAHDLVDEAIERGLHAISITPHLAVFHDPDAVAYAHKRGLLLIPGAEYMIENREVLLIGILPEDVPPSRPMTFNDLRELRAKKDILVIAPHPFYPRKTCVGNRLDDHPDLFDALEIAHLVLPGSNPNERARSWAHKYNKALVANSDTHALYMTGTNTTTVEAKELTPPALFQAIRERRTILHTPNDPAAHFLRFLVQVAGLQTIARAAYGRIRSVSDVL